MFCVAMSNMISASDALFTDFVIALPKVGSQERCILGLRIIPAYMPAITSLHTVRVCVKISKQCVL